MSTKYGPRLEMDPHVILNVIILHGKTKLET